MGLGQKGGTQKGIHPQLIISSGILSSAVSKGGVADKIRVCAGSKEEKQKAKEKRKDINI